MLMLISTVQRLEVMTLSGWEPHSGTYLDRARPNCFLKMRPINANGRAAKDLGLLVAYGNNWHIVIWTQRLARETELIEMQFLQFSGISMKL